MPTFLSASGTRLHYRLCGTGPLLVCHPGGPGRPGSYLDTLGGVDRVRTLLLLDPRGVGGSAPAPSYGYPALAEDLHALRVHLGLDRVDLLAHSAGTFPVLTYAAAYPDRVGRLVLLTPPWLITGPVRDAEMIELAERYYGHLATRVRPHAVDRPAARHRRRHTPGTRTPGGTGPVVRPDAAARRGQLAGGTISRTDISLSLDVVLSQR